MRNSGTLIRFAGHERGMERTFLFADPTLPRHFQRFVGATGCGDRARQLGAGRVLCLLAASDPAAFLLVRRNLRKRFRVRPSSSENIAALAHAREICPPLYVDRLFWSRGAKAGLEFFWADAEEAIRRRGRKLRQHEAQEWFGFCATQLFLDLQRGRYRPHKGSFSCWLRSWLGFRWKDWWRRRASAQPRGSRLERIDPDLVDDEGHAFPIDPWEEGSRLLEKIPWQPERDALWETAVLGRSRAEAAKQIGIHRGEIDRILRRARSFLRRKLSRLQLSAGPSSAAS